MTQPELTMEQVEQIQDCAADMLDSKLRYEIRPSTLYNICTAALAHLRSQPWYVSDEIERLQAALTAATARAEEAERQANKQAIDWRTYDANTKRADGAESRLAALEAALIESAGDLTSRVAALERDAERAKAGWSKGDDGRLHCPCHFVAERKIAAITEQIDELDGLLQFAKYPADGPIRSRISAIRALALRATEQQQQGKP